MALMKRSANAIKENIHVVVDYALIQQNYAMGRWIVPKVMMKPIRVAVSA
jgi:hypothetical protein